MRRDSTLGLARAAMLGLALLIGVWPAAAAGSDCAATAQGGIAGVQGWGLADGGFAAWSGMNINIDGYGRACHRRQGGAVLHLCVGGEVLLPDGTRCHGSASAATCTGRFMNDLALIEAAGWADPAVGVVRWYGVVAGGESKVAGQKISGLEPVLQRDGSGFYVSLTSLVDRSITDVADQRRYFNPLRVPSAVAPRGLLKAGVSFGSYGVAIHVGGRGGAVPFVMGDAGPRIGEGSPALARRVAGLQPSDEITLADRYAGQVDSKSILWVFFGGSPGAFEHATADQVALRAQKAFDAWGGTARLERCVGSVPRP
jgi:hypothetical protein